MRLKRSLFGGAASVLIATSIIGGGMVAIATPAYASTDCAGLQAQYDTDIQNGESFYQTGIYLNLIGNPDEANYCFARADDFYEQARNIQLC